MLSHYASTAGFAAMHTMPVKCYAAMRQSRPPPPHTCRQAGSKEALEACSGRCFNFRLLREPLGFGREAFNTDTILLKRMEGGLPLAAGAPANSTANKLPVPMARLLLQMQLQMRVLSSWRCSHLSSACAACSWACMSSATPIL